jgi:hypothetical protein
MALGVEQQVVQLAVVVRDAPWKTGVPQCPPVVQHVAVAERRFALGLRRGRTADAVGLHCG